MDLQDQNKENTDQNKELIQFFQCTKEQYDNRENLTPKILNSEPADGIDVTFNQPTNNF